MPYRDSSMIARLTPQERVSLRHNWRVGDQGVYHAQGAQKLVTVIGVYQTELHITSVLPGRWPKKVDKAQVEVYTGRGVDAR